VKTIAEYFDKVQSYVGELQRVEIEKYDEQILTEVRGNLRIRLRFQDNSLLEISEAIYINKGNFIWLSYRYHYQNPDGSVIFRYDDTPHHPDVETFPEHKHVGDKVVKANRPVLEYLISEVKNHLITKKR